ncbi:peptidylprolyl isomerase [Synechocystis sp. LKSZ1]|uniref:peptidylprolyl isomerase n=1 Tax=Synechocystis sp. LKSZ1 TaxID=3144951 RepID=UPI00336BCB42
MSTQQNEITVNQTPNDILLSNSNISENQARGALIGTFSVPGANSGSVFTYSLVSGDGGADNNLFTISNNQLRSNSIFDYEAQKTRSIRVRVTDQNGLFYEKTLTINVTNIVESLIQATPINDFFVSADAPDTQLNLKTYFDDPRTTGKIARFQLANSTLGNGEINVVLFDQVGSGAPLTVQNFQTYIDQGRYTNTIIHRSIPSFIVQGGGYSTENFPPLTDIPSNPPVVNEFSPLRSNTRGTIAMAKIPATDSQGNPIPGGGPNSATNEWFFNLNNNSSNLDNQNGGFTAFGQVLSVNDLATMDAIASVTTYNAGSSFPNLPLINYVSGQSVSANNLVRFSSISVSQQPDLTFSITNNTNPLVVNARLEGQQLILDYQPGQIGNADITLRATNLFGEFVEDTFRVTTSSLPNLSIQDKTIREGNNGTKNLTFTVTLSQVSTQPVSVNFATATPTGHTATPSNIATPTNSADYTTSQGTLTIPAGQLTGQINVPIIGDTLDENSETFVVNLSNPVGAVLSNNQAVGTIEQDDTPTNPLVLTGGTVQIAYVAYYGRPGDPGGLAFWNQVFGSQQVVFGSPGFETLANSFGTGSEADRLYGALNNREKVRKVYNLAFNRDPEQGGWDFWTGLLDRNQVTPVNFALAVALGASNGNKPGDNQDLTVIRNKIASADLISNAIDTPLERQATSGPSNEVFGRNWLAPFGDTSASLYAAEMALASFVNNTSL